MMIAVIFEVWPAEGHKEAYLDLAGELRDELDAMDGFISVERFESIYEPGKMLSLSFWRDEAAVSAWRSHTHHRETQSKGRGGIFSNYRLRVAQVQRDYGLNDRKQAPADSRQIHD
jgi:heme-degrading monooxygenase HmoA